MRNPKGGIACITCDADVCVHVHDGDVRQSSRITALEAENAELLRILGENDVELGSGCNAAQPEAIRTLTEHLARAREVIETERQGQRALDAVLREVHHLTDPLNTLVRGTDLLSRSAPKEEAAK